MLEDGGQIDVIYTDFEKAFDRVPHKRLISKLYSYNINEDIIKNHVLYSLLPPPSIASQNYNLRPRTHTKQLPQHSGHLTDSNFTTRMLYTDIY